VAETVSTFNGWTIVTLPSAPPPAFIEWGLADTVGAARSPFSRQQQIQNWSAAIWSASLSYAAMQYLEALPLITFLRNTQGKANVFMFGDPQNLGPQNPSASAGAVSGSGQTGYQLITTSSGLTPGDYFQLGVRLYAVTSVLGGTLGIWPNIRESPASDTALILTNTQGLFRLSSNVRKYSVKPGQMVKPIIFEIEEAI
jgi:hypothetical protein